jgi:hypothetical protein
MLELFKDINELWCNTQMATSVSDRDRLMNPKYLVECARPNIQKRTYRPRSQLLEFYHHPLEQMKVDFDSHDLSQGLDIVTFFERDICNNGVFSDQRDAKSTLSLSTKYKLTLR